MPHYDEDPKYMALIKKISDRMIAPAGKPLDAVMTAADVFADVIWRSFDSNDARLAALDVMLSRIGASLDRRNKRSAN